ncbi:flagellar hook-associated protein 1 FlgK [Kineosphaera limosa]|uniref:Flagellar hook-associated protein 1 n=1 Tax=Kineosphaera limosa NBRC 100340 TaxID=1184609 RepID=K6WZE0_9MICO|nr:flagellar hook-associated protein FlgK [Kineosphaera limosa]NYD99838.1 flagellar hook-associated protein 1 FlgK [Kineosphaera limosa]GAB97487.1 putative flagellar hook-associated protein 1 [Kineosphaera limosa NBRC 100340]
MAFSGLIIGQSAVHAAQRGLDVTGQNISNAATPGYTRQRVDLEAVGGPGVPAFWSQYNGVGEGVRVTGVTRMNDEFLEARARNSNAALGNLQEQAKTMAAIERAVGEPSDTGLQKKLAEFWNSWATAGNSPTAANQAPRAAALENGVNAAAQLNLMGNSLATQYADTVSELEANVTDINKMAEDVAKLNAAIRNNNIARVPSNELLDQRDVLIAKISQLTGATVRPAQADQDAPFNSQAVDVMIGDRMLVNGTNANALMVNDPNWGEYPDDGSQPGAISIEWDPTVGDDGYAGDADIASGRVSGQLKNLNETIPDYLSQFDAIAKQLAGLVNNQQGQGFTVEGTPGADLFIAQGGGGITARNIRVDPDATANSLAVNSTATTMDGKNAQAMARHISHKDGPDATYNAMVVQLGVQTQSVNRNVAVQQNVVIKAEDARDNVAGVSLNEEMTNLIKFQHSFSAAAKFIGVIDQTLDTLIHMTR